MTDDFSSTDSIRGAAPLAHAKTLTLSEPFVTRDGDTLREVVVAYETYGELNDARDNAVLVCHAMSGDSHVARHHPDDDPGWWEELVGPGRAVDTDQLFVICSNVLGGCRGTTGPSSVDPTTGRPYGADFPMVSVEDMVAVQRHLVTHLGIERLRAVIGGSLGGCQALAWATDFPEMVGTAMVIASSARLSQQALAFDVVGRNAIISDPRFAGGQYYDREEQPDTGLAIARMLAHITYLSSASMEQKFEINRHRPRDIATQFEKRFGVGSYLAYQGDRFVERFDANSYVSISFALDQFDMGATPEARRERLRGARCDWLVLSFSSDWLFTPTQSRSLVSDITAEGHRVSYCDVPSDGGHDGFLLPEEIAFYGPLVRKRLGLDAPTPAESHPQHDRILEMIESGTSVLDLGCGDGDLLARLAARGHEDLVGVDVNPEKVVRAVRPGVDVMHHDVGAGLPQFPDQRFDYVVIAATLQAVPDVTRLLLDALRVGRRAIVSLPNFAYRPLREMFYHEGRIPKTPSGDFQYEWYDTPNRRFPSLRDFIALCEELGIELESAQYYVLAEGGRTVPETEDANLMADHGVFVLSRGAD